MKLTAMVPVLALAACAGCSNLGSLAPFFTESDAIVDTALAGVWQNEKGDATFIIRQDEKSYSILYVEGASPSVRFRALLTRVGDAKLLDIVPEDESAFQVAAHHLVRIWIDGSTLRWAFLDSDWMKQHARELASRTTKDRTILTGSPEAAHALMLNHAADPRAFQSPETLTRVQ